MNHEAIHSEFKRIKDHFGFTFVRLSELSEMPISTLSNCYKSYDRAKFTEAQLRRLKINLYNLIKNFELN